MLPLAYVGHGMANRTRLKIPSQRGNRDYFRQLQLALQNHPRIRSAEADPGTGGLLLHHEASLQEIGTFAEELGFFALSREVPDLAALTHQLIGVSRSVDRILREVTHGRLNGTEAGLLVLLSLGLYQLWKGNILPPAAPLLGYVAGIMVATSRAGSPSSDSLP